MLKLTKIRDPRIRIHRRTVAASLGVAPALVDRVADKLHLGDELSIAERNALVIAVDEER